MGKRFNSVSEMVRDISDDQSFVDRFEEESANQSIGRFLFTLRNSKGLTQTELAKKMGVNQSYVSRLEHTPNDKIKIGEMLEFVDAVGYDLTINVHQERNLVGWVKHHVMETRKYLHQLADLTKNDQKIKEGVTNFYYEATVNLVDDILESTGTKLGLAKLKKRAPFIISADISDDDDSVEIEATISLEKC